MFPYECKISERDIAQYMYIQPTNPNYWKHKPQYIQQNSLLEWFIFGRLLDISHANPDEFYKVTEHRLYDQARDAIAEFLGSKPGNLVFVPNTTTGKGILIQ